MAAQYVSYRLFIRIFRNGQESHGVFPSPRNPDIHEQHGKLQLAGHSFGSFKKGSILVQEPGPVRFLRRRRLVVGQGQHIPVFLLPDKFMGPLCVKKQSAPLLPGRFERFIKIWVG
ncbi:hypothetical protein FQZ97_1030010 [compost metagenome]